MYPKPLSNNFYPVPPKACIHTMHFRNDFATDSGSKQLLQTAPPKHLTHLKYWCGRKKILQSICNFVENKRHVQKKSRISKGICWKKQTKTFQEKKSAQATSMIQKGKMEDHFTILNICRSTSYWSTSVNSSIRRAWPYKIIHSSYYLTR